MKINFSNNSFTMNSQPKSPFPLRPSVSNGILPDGWDFFAIDQPQSKLRKIVELVFYLTLLITVFRLQLGISGKVLIAGGTVAAAGLFTFIVYVVQRETLPRSFYFIVAINVAANLSQMIGQGELLFIGSGLPKLLHWCSITLMMCYLVRNHAAEKRMLVFLSVVIFLAAIIGGIEKIHYDTTRLALEAVGGAFRNPNQLAYLSGLFSIALLFSSLRSSNTVRILLWTLAFVLFVVLLQTLSRGGMAVFLCGLACLLIAALLTRGKRITGFTLLITVLIGGSLIGSHYTQQFDQLSQRIHEESYSARLGIYQEDLFGDLSKTILLGTGPESAITSQGLTAHNSFIYTHMAFGGPSGYILLVWLLYLGWSVTKVFFSRNIPLDIRMMLIALFGIMLGSNIFSNQGYVFLSSIYAVAVIEKYTNRTFT